MRWASAVSQQDTLPAALDEVNAAVREALRGESIDFAIVFVSHHFVAEYDDVPARIRDHLGGSGADLVVVCTAARPALDQALASVDRGGKMYVPRAINSLRISF